jgi:hypothetical protein
MQASWRLQRASCRVPRPVGAGVACYKQRLQQLFLPEGIAFDGNRFNRTAVAVPVFKYLAAGEQAEEGLASPGETSDPFRQRGRVLRA